MATSQQVEEFRQAQSQIRTLAERDLRDYLESLSLDVTRADVVRDATAHLCQSVVNRYGLINSQMAADLFEQMRKDKNARGEYRPTVADLTSDEAIDATTRYQARQLFIKETGLTAFTDGMVAALGRWILNAGRDTIIKNAIADKSCVGYARVAHGETCDFCTMLAGRGAVYVKETGGFASHDHCDCTAEPSWDTTRPLASRHQLQAAGRMDRLRKRANSDDPKVRAQAQAVLERRRTATREYLAHN